MKSFIIISFLLLVVSFGFGQNTTKSFLDTYGLYVKMKYPCKLLEYKGIVNVIINVDSTCNVVKISQSPTLENKCDNMISDVLDLLEKDLKKKFNTQCSVIVNYTAPFKFPEEY